MLHISKIFINWVSPFKCQFFSVPNTINGETFVHKKIYFCKFKCIVYFICIAVSNNLMKEISGSVSCLSKFGTYFNICQNWLYRHMVGYVFLHNEWIGSFIIWKIPEGSRNI